jgi:L-lactate dehydrogenase complex protein LldG
VGSEAEMDRARFLKRIRNSPAMPDAADAHQTLPTSTEGRAAQARQIRADALSRWSELLARFGSEMEAVGGVVHSAGVPDLAGVIGRIARERGLTHVVTWSEESLSFPGLLARLGTEGLKLEGVTAAGESVGGVQRIPYAGIAWAEVGLTGTDFAIADSGTLVLQSGVGKDRLVSCLPAIHIAILRPGQLLNSLEEVGVLLERERQQADSGDTPRAIDFITGPSRTADIEMSLTRGAHGPKEVHVIAVS